MPGLDFKSLPRTSKAILALTGAYVLGSYFSAGPRAGREIQGNWVEASFGDYVVDLPAPRLTRFTQAAAIKNDGQKSVGSHYAVKVNKDWELNIEYGCRLAGKTLRHDEPYSFGGIAALFTSMPDPFAQSEGFGPLPKPGTLAVPAMEEIIFIPEYSKEISFTDEGYTYWVICSMGPTQEYEMVHAMTRIAPGGNYDWVRSIAPISGRPSGLIADLETQFADQIFRSIRRASPRA